MDGRGKARLYGLVWNMRESLRASFNSRAPLYVVKLFDEWIIS